MSQNDNDNDNVNVLHGNDLVFATKFCFGVGHMFNDLCAAIWFSYMLFYLQIILQISPSISGILLMIGQIVDAFSTPLSGWVINKYGGQKSWHLLGSILVLCSFPMMFSFCFYCNENIRKFLYFCVLITIFQVGWAIVQISHLSLIPMIANTSKERSDLTALRYISSVFASVTVYLITALILHLNDDSVKHIGPQDYFKFRDIVLIIVAIGFTFTTIFYVGIKDTFSYVQIEDNQADGATISESNNQIHGLKNLFSTTMLYQVAFLYVASRLYVTLNLIYMPLYLDERQKNNDIINQTKISIAIVPLFLYLSSFLTSLVIKFRLQGLSDKVVYFIGSLIALFGCNWIRFAIIPHSSIIQVYILAILIGIGTTTTIVSSLCITAELISKQIENSALIYSIVTFLDKLICGIAVVIIEHLKCKNWKMCPNYYSSIMNYVSSSVIVFGLFILLTLILKRN